MLLLKRGTRLLFRPVCLPHLGQINPTFSISKRRENLTKEFRTEREGASFVCVSVRRRSLPKSTSFNRALPVFLLSESLSFLLAPDPSTTSPVPPSAVPSSDLDPSLSPPLDRFFPPLSLLSSFVSFPYNLLTFGLVSLSYVSPLPDPSPLLAEG